MQRLESAELSKRGIELFVKRDDLIHMEVSGNKWRKLKYNIEQFKILQKNKILTFGGAYSNHLLATASACNAFGIKSIGIVRGDELNKHSNTVLERCHELGMQLEFVSREEYALRGMSEYYNELNDKFENCYIIPEGGANYYGMIGCQEILSEIDLNFDEIFVAQGTTTTSCGLLLGIQNARLNVVPVLKGFDSLSEMRSLLQKTGIHFEDIDELLSGVRVLDAFHFGGYARSTEQFDSFCNEIMDSYSLPLDKVYTGKAFYAMLSTIESSEFDGKKVVFIHTGGVHEI